MPAINAVGKIGLCGGRGILYIDSELPSAEMNALHAPLLPGNRINCDAVQVDTDVIGGSVKLLTIDSVAGLERVAAYGGAACTLSAPKVTRISTTMGISLRLVAIQLPCDVRVRCVNVDVAGVGMSAEY